MEWNKVMRTRKSCREYIDEQITTAQLKALLEAGCAAPVARGKFEQLQLTVVQDKELLDNILYSGVWVNYRGKRKEADQND